MCLFRHKRDQGNNSNTREVVNKSWKCEELDWNDDPCVFKTLVKVRYQNHMKAYHEDGSIYYCDDCDLQTDDRKNLKDHVENIHGKTFLTCDGNCNDRLYDENAFTCETCKDYACVRCGKADTAENSALDPEKTYCYGCV